MTKIRVLVVEDSLTVRKHLVATLGSDPDFEVVGEAADGKQAIELCERLRPDVITIDMMLPVMSGLAATEYIMAYCPTPIVIVSGSINRGEWFKTYEALAAGAVDVVEKPRGDISDEQWNHRLTATVKMASRIKVITHLRGRLQGLRRPNHSFFEPLKGELERPPRYVGIGASTGGPRAIGTILSGLPGDFPLPILVVIHISPFFGCAMAEWLNDISPIPVAIATDGEPLPAVGKPRVLLAPPDRHLVVRGPRLALTTDPEIHSCRPAVDVLFATMARELGDRAIAVLLTGMGKDGAQGMLEVRGAGGVTLTQDESTSLVFGMPREAIRIGAAQQVLPLERMAPALISLADDKSRSR